MAPRRTSTKGFKRTDSLLSAKIRQASETRGFAQSRLLTQWAEIVGQDVAAISRPVEVSYGRGGMGATLTLLTTGANAPMLEMQKEQLRAKVNAIYGFNAIARGLVAFNNAAGTAVYQGAIDNTHKYMSAFPVELGLDDPQSQAKTKRMMDKVAELAAFMNADADEIGKFQQSLEAGQQDANKYSFWTIDDHDPSYSWSSPQAFPQFRLRDYCLQSLSRRKRRCLESPGSRPWNRH